MAKGDQRRQENRISNERDYTRNQLGNYRASIMPRQSAWDERFNQVWDPLFSGIGEYMSGAGNYSPAMGSYRNFAATGGVDPAQLARIRGNAGDLEQFANRGLTPSELEALRGYGVYKEFAETGGWSPERIRGETDRATDLTRSIFSTRRDDLSRANLATGGYVTPAAFGQNARMAAREAQDNLRDTRLGIFADQNKNRLLGAQGGTSSEATIQDILNQRKSLLGPASNIRLGAEGLVQGGKMFGTEGMSREHDASYARRLAGLGMYGSLADLAAGQSNYYDSQNLAALGMDIGAGQNYLGLFDQNTRRPGFWDRAGQFAGIGAGLLAPWLQNNWRRTSESPYGNAPYS